MEGQVPARPRAAPAARAGPSTRSWFCKFLFFLALSTAAEASPHSHGYRLCSQRCRE